MGPLSLPEILIWIPVTRSWQCSALATPLTVSMENTKAVSQDMHCW